MPTTLLKGTDHRYNRHYTIPILYQSSSYLIVDKPFNLRIDGPTVTSPTLEWHLQEYLREQQQNSEQSKEKHQRLHLLHQLDYVTSGIHCWALNKKAASNVGKLFERRRISKVYVALVKGHLVEDELEIIKPIAIDPNNTTEYKMKIGCNGKPARTLVSVLKRGYYNNIPITHVHLTPLTGRKHQLRVHLSSIGHPILGDMYYDSSFSKTDTEHRTMLHALRIEIPLVGEEMRVKTEDPFVSMVQQVPFIS